MPDARARELNTAIQIALLFALGVVIPPEPFKKVAVVLLAVLAVLVVIGILLSLVGGLPGGGPVLRP